MTRRILFRLEAELDVEDAYRWYEARHQGLGADFLRSVEEILDRVARYPEMYPTVHMEVRRALIRRFPYGVFYVVEEEAIVVQSVFHSRRDPKQW